MASRDTYPEQARAEAVGKRRWEQIKDSVGVGKHFENEAAKRDYERRVRSNPDNVLGLPTFLPTTGSEGVFAGQRYLSIPCPSCGSLNEWSCSTRASSSGKVCMKCGKFVEWNKEQLEQQSKEEIQ